MGIARKRPTKVAGPITCALFWPPLRREVIAAGITAGTRRRYCWPIEADRQFCVDGVAARKKGHSVVGASRTNVFCVRRESLEYFVSDLNSLGNASPMSRATRRSLRNLEGGRNFGPISRETFSHPQTYLAEKRTSRRRRVIRPACLPRAAKVPRRICGIVFRTFEREARAAAALLLRLNVARRRKPSVAAEGKMSPTKRNNGPFTTGELPKEVDRMPLQKNTPDSPKRRRPRLDGKGIVRTSEESKMCHSCAKNCRPCSNTAVAATAVSRVCSPTSAPSHRIYNRFKSCHRQHVKMQSIMSVSSKPYIRRVSLPRIIHAPVRSRTMIVYMGASLCHLSGFPSDFIRVSLFNSYSSMQ